MSLADITLSNVTSIVAQAQADVESIVRLYVRTELLRFSREYPKRLITFSDTMGSVDIWVYAGPKKDHSRPHYTVTEDDWYRSLGWSAMCGSTFAGDLLFPLKKVIDTYCMAKGEGLAFTINDVAVCGGKLIDL